MQSANCPVVEYVMATELDLLSVLEHRKVKTSLKCATEQLQMYQECLIIIVSRLYIISRED